MFPTITYAVWRILWIRSVSMNLWKYGYRSLLHSSLRFATRVLALFQLIHHAWKE